MPKARSSTTDASSPRVRDPVRRAAIFASMLVMGESSVSGNGVLPVGSIRFYHDGVTYRRVVAAALAIATASVACTGSPAPRIGSSGSGTSGPAPITMPLTPEALPLVDVAGFQELLRQLHGRPVVVNVWASWCAPCIAEAPILRQAALANPKVRFLGVDILDSRDGAVGFIHDHAIPYPSVFDPPGAIRDSLRLQGQPDTLFYDANGVLQATWIGQISQATLDQNLAKIAS